MRKHKRDICTTKTGILVHSLNNMQQNSVGLSLLMKQQVNRMLLAIQKLLSNDICSSNLVKMLWCQTELIQTSIHAAICTCVSGIPHSKWGSLFTSRLAVLYACNIQGKCLLTKDIREALTAQKLYVHMKALSCKRNSYVSMNAIFIWISLYSAPFFFFTPLTFCIVFRHASAIALLQH